MKVSAERANQYNQSKAVANHFYPEKGNSTAIARESLPAIPDKSPYHAAQRKIQELINNSERVMAQRKHLANMWGGTVQKSENKTHMPDEVKTKMEHAFQADFSDVRIHANSALAPDVGALAFTQGNDVHFAPGQFSPTSTQGQKLLGHELTHVVQQREGRVKPTLRLSNGLMVNDSPTLEREADAGGIKAGHSI